MLARLKAYALLMRLNRPWPILLILFPTCWGLVAGPQHPHLRDILIFLTGVFLTRSAGCVINDYFDRHIDGRVVRTQQRPLAIKSIRPVEAILLFLILMFFAGLLLFFLKPDVMALGCIAFFLALFYPLAKRFTYFPQIFLGVAFNFGLLMAALEVNATLDLRHFAYYAFAVLWTVHYDTLYALTDYEDDLRAGIKSIPSFFKDRINPFLSFTAILCILTLGLIWGLTGFTVNRIILFCMIILFFIFQYFTLRRQGRSAGLRLFKQHVFIGLAVLLGF